MPNYDQFLMVASDYFSLLPLDLIKQINERLYQISPLDRRRFWESLGLPLVDLRVKFAKMAETRVELVKSQGYDSYVEVYLRKYKIPEQSYKSFVNEIDSVIGYCNENLPKRDNLPSWFYSEFNLPCFMCRMATFPFKSLGEVFGYVCKKHPEIRGYRDKIDIISHGSSWMTYEEGSGVFKVMINKNPNIRHKAIDLIHELSHVVCYIRDFRRSIDPFKKGVYEREKAAFEVEIDLLKQISDDLFRTRLVDILLTIRKNLFEVGMYNNPDQDLGKLYASTFNRCFHEAKQKDNPLYLINEDILVSPFKSLPHVVVYSEVILREVDLDTMKS